MKSYNLSITDNTTAERIDVQCVDKIDLNRWIRKITSERTGHKLSVSYTESETDYQKKLDFEQLVAFFVENAHKILFAFAVILVLILLIVIPVSHRIDYNNGKCSACGHAYSTNVVKDSVDGSYSMTYHCDSCGHSGWLWWLTADEVKEGK